MPRGEEAAHVGAGFGNDNSGGRPAWADQRRGQGRGPCTGCGHCDERVSPWRGSAYGVVAAVNTYTHHELAVRGADHTTRNSERVVFGKVDALDT